MVPLETTKLFGGLSPAEWETLRKSVVLKEFPENCAIFQEGDPGDGVYVVADGEIQIIAFVNQSERRPLGKILPGDFFGEMAVLDNEPRSATALTTAPSTCYFIPREDLLRMLDTSPRLAVSLVREFSLRMRDFNRQYIREVLQAERLTLVGKFARSIVHDFKNPLNIIGLAADLAGMERASPQMRQTASGRIRKQVNRLSTMITELLEFTRGSQAVVVMGETNYGTYVRQILEEIRPEVQEKNVVIECEGELPDVALPLDTNRLTHVFFNLIHNAVDAMPGGGQVKIRFEIRDKEVVTEIEDSGKGLAPEIIGRLFEAFATFGKAQGTGLGLSICKKIIEDHRGWIKATSPAGRGAVFMFGLPVKR